MQRAELALAENGDLDMKALKTLVLAAVAAASLATAAEAGQKKHNFYKPHWVGTHYDDCWDYRKVPQYYYSKVRYYQHGKPYWKKVKKVRYVNERYYACDVRAY
jgi:hypothetical protein